MLPSIAVSTFGFKTVLRVLRASDGFSIQGTSFYGIIRQRSGIFSPLLENQVAVSTFAKTPLLSAPCNHIIRDIFPLFTEKKLRTQISPQFFCEINRCFIKSTKPCGSMTFTHGPNESMRITISVSSLS